MSPLIELSVLLQSCDNSMVVRKHIDMFGFEAVRPEYQLDSLREAVTRLMHEAIVDVFDHLAAQHLPEQLVRIYHPHAVVEVDRDYRTRTAIYRVMSDQPLPINMDPSDVIKQPARAILGLGTTEDLAWHNAWSSEVALRGVKAWDAMRRR